MSDVCARRLDAPLLLSVFPTFDAGGAQMRFVTVINNLGGRWRHAIIAMDGAIGCSERLAPSLDVVFPHFTASKGHLIEQVSRIRAVLRRLRPDVMLTHNWGSIEWGLANSLGLSIPHVHAEDGFGPEERVRQLPRRIWTRRLALRHSTVAMPSRTLLWIARERWRLRPAGLRHIPNGVDLARFVPRTVPGLPDQWGLPPDGVVVGTVAALRPEKNIARLIEAVASGDERLLLVVAGDGPERLALEQLAAARAPGRVAFLGHIADPAPLYGHFDIFALSSDTEQMPLSLLEAMASGLPVASTEVGDIAHMVAAENQPFVAGHDARTLADALSRLASSVAQRQTVGAANRARSAQHYGEATMISAWERLLIDAMTCQTRTVRLGEGRA